MADRRTYGLVNCAGPARTAGLVGLPAASGHLRARVGRTAGSCSSVLKGRYARGELDANEHGRRLNTSGSNEIKKRQRSLRCLNHSSTSLIAERTRHLCGSPPGVRPAGGDSSTESRVDLEHRSERQNANQVRRRARGVDSAPGQLTWVEGGSKASALVIKLLPATSACGDEEAPAAGGQS
jgi:hypothetical protein